MIFEIAWRRTVAAKRSDRKRAACGAARHLVERCGVFVLQSKTSRASDFTCCPARAGRNYRRKQQFIMAGRSSVALVFGGILAAVMWWLSQPQTLTRALDRAGAVVTMRTNSMKFFRFIPMLAVAFCAAGRCPRGDGRRHQGRGQRPVITYAEVEDFPAPAADALRRQYAGAAGRLPAEAQRDAQRQPGTTGRTPADSAQL